MGSVSSTQQPATFDSQEPEVTETLSADDARFVETYCFWFSLSKLAKTT